MSSDQCALVLLRCPDWVNIIAFTRDGRLALVRQFRHGIEDYTYEFPGGIVDQGVDLLYCAKQELLEETGLVANNWSKVASFRPNSALQNNWCHTFLCTAAEPVKAASENGCAAVLVDATTFASHYKSFLLQQALMATALLLAREAPLPSATSQLCKAFFD